MTDQPKDEVETMLAAQMAAIHSAVKCYCGRSGEALRARP
jgi:hypothetical protein